MIVVREYPDVPLWVGVGILFVLIFTCLCGWLICGTHKKEEKSKKAKVDPPKVDPPKVDPPKVDPPTQVILVPVPTNAYGPAQYPQPYPYAAPGNINPPTYPQQGAAYPPQQGAAYPPQQGAAYPPQQGAAYPAGAAYPPQQGAAYPQQGVVYPYPPPPPPGAPRQ